MVLPHCCHVRHAQLLEHGAASKPTERPVSPSARALGRRPAILALVLSTALSSAPCLRLSRPERASIAVECTYQNTGIATSLALSMFDGHEASRAAGVPLYYSTVQLVLIASYLFACWRLEWTYAPPTDPLWQVLKESYQGRASHAGGRARVSNAASAETGEGGCLPRSIARGGVEPEVGLGQLETPLVVPSPLALHGHGVGHQIL